MTDAANACDQCLQLKDKLRKEQGQQIESFGQLKIVLNEVLKLKTEIRSKRALSTKLESKLLKIENGILTIINLLSNI